MPDEYDLIRSYERGYREGHLAGYRARAEAGNLSPVVWDPVVYVLTEQVRSDPERVLGVYRTREAAEAEVTRRTQADYWQATYRILPEQVRT